ncbi:hypothetical protein SS50377_27130 [Spironucleus salmonicida]|uniref:Uncharacterized protein n=1 Tax=Spironucleus salmonicida TaxID=348837 RepID=A0A9P8LMM6_9EUKA|nr:hypothetical protein SS50377_27130 [Spironucleus salmonicida]
MACEEDLWGQQVGSQLGSLSMVIWAYAIVGWQITALQVDLENSSFKAGGAQFNAAQIKLLRSILSACQPCRAPKIRQMEYFRRILVIQTFPDVEIKQVCKELIKLRQTINSILYQTSICCIGTISLSITSLKLPIIQPQLASKSASKYSLD